MSLKRKLRETDARVRDCIFYLDDQLRSTSVRIDELESATSIQDTMERIDSRLVRIENTLQSIQDAQMQRNIITDRMVRLQVDRMTQLQVTMLEKMKSIQDAQEKGIADRMAQLQVAIFEKMQSIQDTQVQQNMCVADRMEPLLSTMLEQIQSKDHKMETLQDTMDNLEGYATDNTSQISEMNITLQQIMDKQKTGDILRCKRIKLGKDTHNK